MIPLSAIDNQELQYLDYCVVDTETTGAQPYLNRIIDVAVIHYRDGIIYDRFNSLINPGVPIPFWITMLTGINDEMVKDAPSFAELARPLRQILEKGIFTAHNAPFDYGFLQHEFRRMGEIFESPQLCTVRLARRLFPELKSRSLGSLCDHLLVDILDRHRALGDAEATVYVMKNMIQKLGRENKISTWGELQAFFNSGNLVLPQGIGYSDIFRLPESGGEYLIKDARGAVVFKGKTGNIQKRIKRHFAKSNLSERSKLLKFKARKIEFTTPVSS